MVDPSNQVSPVPEFEGFEDLVLLGAGGMGTVYRALDVERGSHCAIKVLRSNTRACSKTMIFMNLKFQ